MDRFPVHHKLAIMAVFKLLIVFIHAKFDSSFSEPCLQGILYRTPKILHVGIIGLVWVHSPFIIYGPNSLLLCCDDIGN